MGGTRGRRIIGRKTTGEIWTQTSNQLLLSVNYMRTMSVFARGPIGTKEEMGDRN